MKTAHRWLNIIASILILTLMSTSIVSAAPQAAETQMVLVPSATCGQANVDGDISEWDLTNDFFANMYRAAKMDKPVESKLYLRYDAASETLYVLVLAEPDVEVLDIADDAYVKLGNSDKLVDGTSGDDGTPPDFAWVMDGEQLVGWEASLPFEQGYYDNLNVHTQVSSDGEAQTSAVADRAIPLMIECDVPPSLPEACLAYSDAFDDGIVDARWTSVDINPSGGDPLGSTSESGGRLRVTSDGSTLFYENDDQRFVYQEVTGDFDVTVQIASTTLDASEWSKAGLMVRESLAPNSERVMIHFTHDHGLQFAYRKDGGSDRLYPDTDVDGLPVWVGIERDSNIYFFSYSTDGVNWTEAGWFEVDLGASPYVGLSVASYEDDEEQGAEFEDFTLCQYSPPEPPEPPKSSTPTITTTQVFDADVCGQADIALSVTGVGEVTTYHRPVDIMIVLDSSGSMDDAGQNPDQPLQDAKHAAKVLIDQLDEDYDRVGLVSYARDAEFAYPLSTRYAEVKAAIDDLDADGYTNLGDGLYEAREVLVAYGREDAVPVIVVLSDGVANRSHDDGTCDLEPATHTACTEDAIAQAEAAKDLDVTIYSIGLNLGGVGNDATEEIARATLEAVASASAYYEAPESSDLVAIYEQIAEQVINVAAYDARIIASLPDGVSYIEGSGSLEPTDMEVVGDNTTLTWNVGIVPIAKSRTVSFSVEVELPGESTLLNAYPQTRVEYRDQQDALRELDFPNAEMAVEILPCNEPPVAQDDTAETYENTPVDIPVLDNDSDPDKDELTITEVGEPANGTAVVNEDGTVTYTPDTGFSGEDSFTYTISDGNGGTDTATVTVTVVELASVRPILECVVDNFDGTYTAFFGYKNENAFPVMIPVGANNKFSPIPTDRGQPTTFEPGRTPYWPDAAFSVVFNGDNLVWSLDGRTSTASRNSTPCSDHVFIEKEWYDAKDNLLDAPPENLPEDFTIVAESALGTATCTYPEGATELLCTYDNARPALDNKGLWVPVGTTYTVSESGLPGDWEERSGTGEFMTGLKAYCEAGFEGMTKYCLHTVINNEIPNDPPVAEDDEAETLKNTPVDIPVLDNDSDPDGDEISITEVGDPANGTAVVNEDGTVTYTPDAGFSGEDSFTYTISDGNGGTDSATVTVTVVNQPPVAEDDEAETLKNTPVDIPVLDNDSDPDGDEISITEVGDPANGTAVVNEDGTVTYTPDAGFSGEDSFTYTISDGNGGTDSATVTVTVVNQPPVAEDDEAETNQGQPVDIPVLNNDSDPDGDDLSITEVGDPANGTAVVNEDGTVTYTPDAGFSGEDSFTYTISDGDGGTDTATVTVTVNPFAPAIEIIKTALLGEVGYVYDGQTVEYRITVTNIGDVDLTDVTVTDAKAPACDQVIGDLAVDESTSYPCDVVVTVGDEESSFTNTAIAEGLDAVLGGLVQDEDDATVEVRPHNPDISITKSALNEGALNAGDTAMFRITVQNTGDVALHDVVVTDALAPACAKNIGYLDAGEIYEPYDCELEGVTESFTNEAEVQGLSPLDEVVTDEDDAYVEVISLNPDIAVRKYLSNEGDIYSGGTALFYIEVENTGDVDLYEVNVTDAKAPGCDQVIGELAVGQVEGYSCELTDVAESFVNVAVAQGTDSFGTTVTSEGSVDVPVVEMHPDITIEKSLLNEGDLESGASATFNIWVENTGDVDLYDVTVTDEQAPTCDQVIGYMAVGDSDSYQCTLDNVTESFTNEAVAEGMDPAGDPVTASDTAEVVVDDNEDSIPPDLRGQGDADGDGIPDYLDDDDDNDGIPDELEGSGDADGDGIPNYLDDDSDNDGIPDAIEGAGDADGDGIPDYLDDDSDNDGIPDAIEGSGDTDGDGIPDYLDGDADNDTIPDAIEGAADVDGDGIPNYLDEDSDGDGIPDAVEGYGDADGDGIPDYLDDDADGDNIPDAIEGYVDTDGDGIADYLDQDSDGDGIPDAVEGYGDADGDTIPDYVDDDADGDGIPDALEGNVDTDGDGIPDYLDLDSDGDGIPGSVEGYGDTDGDGIPDYLDTDADGDGIPDEIEGVTDADGDGIPNYLDTDADGDTIPDAVEGSVDTDGDGVADFLDLDSDDDGIPDAVEGAGDSDGDGVADYVDTDADGDGIPDAVEHSGDADGDGLPDVDADGDGIPNYLDLDSDGDGVLDEIEGTGDKDEDGIPNYLDPTDTVDVDEEFPNKVYFPLCRWH